MNKRKIEFVILSVVGVVLYEVCTEIALIQRGYYAIGGETFLLILPHLCATLIHSLHSTFRNKTNRKVNKIGLQKKNP